MSNRVDFFQSGRIELSLPAATVSVFVDGVLCPELELIEVVHGSWPEFSWVRLAYNPAAYPQAELTVAEEIESVTAMGKRIRIEWFYNGCAPGASAFSFPIFEGKIEGIDTKLGPSGERIDIVAKDFSANIDRVTVYGQRVSSSDGSTVFLAGVDTIFNEDGKANSAVEYVENNGKSYAVFCAEPSQSRPWSYADVIYYLLCEYLPNSQLGAPSIEQLEALTENQIVQTIQ